MFIKKINKTYNKNTFLAFKILWVLFIFAPIAIWSQSIGSGYANRVTQGNYIWWLVSLP